MQALVQQAMEEGAVGLASSLIYAPAFYADTDELIALSKTAAQCGGRYISHIRSEGNQLLEAVDELINIAEEAQIGAEIYHLKAAGKDNWPKIEQVFEKIEAVRARAPMEISPACWANTCAMNRSSRLQEAIRRLTSFPAANLGIKRPWSPAGRLLRRPRHF